MAVGGGKPAGYGRAGGVGKADPPQEAEDPEADEGKVKTGDGQDVGDPDPGKEPAHLRGKVRPVAEGHCPHKPRFLRGKDQVHPAAEASGKPPEGSQDSVFEVPGRNDAHLGRIPDLQQNLSCPPVAAGVKLSRAGGRLGQIHLAADKDPGARGEILPSRRALLRKKGIGKQKRGLPGAALLLITRSLFGRQGAEGSV